MAENDVDRKIGELSVELGKLVDVHEELDVPAERADRVRKLAQRFKRQHAFAFLQVDDVAANAAHPERVELFNLAPTDIEGQHCDAAQALRILLQRIQKSAIVG